jgi:hypothetical protein
MKGTNEGKQGPGSGIGRIMSWLIFGVGHIFG